MVAGEVRDRRTNGFMNRAGERETTKTETFKLLNFVFHEK